MKLIILYTKQIILTILLIICSQYYACSQGTDLSRGKHSGIYFGIGVNPSQSQIINEKPSSLSGLLSTKENVFSGSFEIGYFFSYVIGLSSGLGFVPYKTQLSLANYQNNYNTTDSENDSYERQVTGSNIKEEQKLGFMIVPICLNLRLPFNRTSGFFLQPGINLAFPLSKDYRSNGVFTYKGYYPDYNVLLEDLSSYGFPTSLKSDADGELELKSLIINIVGSVGIDFFIQEKIQVAIAGSYNKSLSGISNYPSPENFMLSSDAGSINSIMGGSSKVTLQSMGISISLRYYLK
jgi:hypothetical protein